MTRKKCLVLFSGGLDSRLAIKIMQKKKFEITAIFFKLPFGETCEKRVKDFLKKEKIKLKILNCTKGKLLEEYLNVIKSPKYGRGAGVNPCIDCRIFLLKKAKKFADKEKINFIVTGEVTGQRPFSQYKKQLELVEKESGLQKRIIRPLIDYENISGRSRKKQIALAKKFQIKYPFPAGGCLLCEKILKNRFSVLLKRELNKEEIKLISIGRHFILNSSWIIIGRNEKENKVLEKSKAGTIIEQDFPAPSAIVMLSSFHPSTSTKQKIPLEIIKKVNTLIQAYSKKGSLADRKKFEKHKL